MFDYLDYDEGRASAPERPWDKSLRGPAEKLWRDASATLANWRSPAVDEASRLVDGNA
jgi:hypothetical protein